MVSISSIPNQTKTVVSNINEFNFNYTEIASPLIAGGIIISSLFFVKSVHDKRRIDGLLQNDITKSS